MVSRILVPMDDSEMAERALEFALESHPGANITVVHVVGGPSGMMGKATTLALSDDVEGSAEELAEDIFDRAGEIAAEHEADIETTIEYGHPVRAILNDADEYDLIVLGSHGGSLRDRLFVGDVASKVFNRSPVPVTAVR